VRQSPRGFARIDKRGGCVVKRAILLALCVILVLALAAPIAAGQPTSEGQQGRGNLAAAWWNWGFATSPSPLEGSYGIEDPRCDGEYVDGVFFVAGNTGGASERTCTVPAVTPIFFPVFNVICGEAPTVPTDGGFTGDPEPYPQCAQAFLSNCLAEPSEWFATLDGEDLQVRRMASGVFDWTVASDDNPFGVPADTYESASDGLWVYLPRGLEPGEYTLHFGGTFYCQGPTEPPFSLDVTYHLIVE